MVKQQCCWMPCRKSSQQPPSASLLHAGGGQPCWDRSQRLLPQSLAGLSTQGCTGPRQGTTSAASQPGPEEKQSQVLCALRVRGKLFAAHPSEEGCLARAGCCWRCVLHCPCHSLRHHVRPQQHAMPPAVLTPALLPLSSSTARPTLPASGPRGGCETGVCLLNLAHLSKFRINQGCAILTPGHMEEGRKAESLLILLAFPDTHYVRGQQRVTAPSVKLVLTRLRKVLLR